MSAGEEVNKPFGPVEAVPYEPVRASDGSIDVEATVAMLDKRFARESFRYRLSPLRRMHRRVIRALIGRPGR
jgi:hypothetical protein